MHPALQQWQRARYLRIYRLKRRCFVETSFKASAEMSRLLNSLAETGFASTRLPVLLFLHQEFYGNLRLKTFDLFCYAAV